MRKAIVTGANGFIGSALCTELTEQGIEVIAVVRNNAKHLEEIQRLSGLRVVSCDLSNFSSLPEIIDDRDADVLYHLAWVGSAGPLRGDNEVQLDNIRYACNTVKACKELNIHRFVFASSIMEYEIQAVMDTEVIPGINTLYSTAKLTADYMCKTISGTLGIEYIRGVISNIYGPGETSPRLINTSLRKMLSGKHCAFSAGNQNYDFIYITDAAKTFRAIGDKGINNHTYYIGSQNPHSLKEFLCEMRDQVNPNIEIGIGEIPFNGISLSYNEFDVKAVQKDTGFIPEVSFANGIKNTTAWIKKQLEEDQ